MKKLVSILLSLSLAMVLLVGCGNKEKPSSSGDPDPTPPANQTKDSIVFNLGAEPKTLDPTLNTETVSSHIINHTFEGLYREIGGKTVPGVALSHEVNEDGTVYTFKLREDAKWSDGQAVTAKDFVFAWQRLVTPETASDYATLLAPVLNANEIIAAEKQASELGVKAVSDFVFEVTLAKPTSYFEKVLTFNSLVPVREDVVDDEGAWAIDPAKFVSNGPYKLTDYKISDEIVLEKVDTYWNKDTITLNKITAKMITDESTVLTAFRAGDILLAENAPPEEIPMLEASGEITYIDMLGTYFIALNQSGDNEVVKNPLVREAISLSIDRQALIDNVLRAGQRPATGLVSYGFKDDSGKEFRDIAGDYGMKPTADIEAAKALLIEAGYPGGEGIPALEYAYNTSERHKAVAEFLKEALNEIGIEVTLKNQEWAVFIDYRKDLLYPDMIRHAWVGDYVDPMTFLDMYITGATNGGTGWASPEYDKLIEEAMGNLEDSFTQYAAAEKLLMENGGVIPLFYDTSYVLVDPEIVIGWEKSVTGPFWFGNATVNEKEA